MKIEVSNKIRLALNELAILNQPEVIDEKYFYNVDTLVRLKELSTDMYFLADMALNQHAGLAQTPEKVIPDTPETVIPDTPIVVVAPPAEVVEELPVIEVALPEVPLADVKPMNIEIPIIPPPLPPVEIPNVIASETPLQNGFLSSKISITRRFEYINNLFAGNADAFMAFLNEIEVANSLEASLDIFERDFEQRAWKKKSETASDLKSLIKKYVS